MKKTLLYLAFAVVLSSCSSTKNTTKTQTEIDIAPGITGNARELVRVTNDPIPEFGPKVSPDGKKIIFYTIDNNKTGFEKWSIVYIKIGEPGRIPLVGSFTSSPNWMPDSKGILFQYLQPSKPVICKGNIDGSTGISYVSPSGMGDFDSDPQISTDGKKILFSSKIGTGYQICMMDATGNNFTVLTKGNSPYWHPSGSSFVYQNIVGNYYQLFSYDLKSGQSTQLTSGEHHNYSPSINLKGDKMAFISTRAKNAHVFISAIGGNEVIQVTQGNTQNTDPVFGPNDIIYFCSNAGGSVKKTTTTTNSKFNRFLGIAQTSQSTQQLNEINVSLLEYADIWSVQVR